MARDQEDIVLAKGDIIELTDSDATQVTFYVSEGAITIRTGTTTTPTAAQMEHGPLYGDGEGEYQIPLVSIGGGSRVWARGVSKSNIVRVTTYA